MNARATARELHAEDGALVDLVTDALVDPNLHTDMRMRLSNEIVALLRAAHRDLYGPDAHDTHERAAPVHDGPVPAMLEAVLVDPHLHTDLRMRLHQEITELLSTARPAKVGRGRS